MAVGRRMIEKWLFVLNVGYAGEIGLAKRVPFKDHLPKGGKQFDSKTGNFKRP